MTDNSPTNIRLRACLKEIEKLMSKYDAGGYIILADSVGGEFKYINPKWSVLKTGTGNVQIDTKSGWFKHRLKTQELSDRTVHLLQVIQDASAKGYRFSNSTLDQIKKHFEIEGGPVEVDT